MKKRKELEIDPVDGLAIDDHNIFGWSIKDEKIEDFDDFAFKYLRPFYRLFKTYIPDFKFWLKRNFQRLVRKNHLADVDTWNMCHTIGPNILKNLQAFYDYEGHGHPAYFSEWGYEGCTDTHGGLGITKEEYEEYKAKGIYGGGEMEAWKATVKEMIFAFEYNTLESRADKFEAKFYEKWDLLNPYRKTEDNLSWGYSFEGKDGTHMSCGQCDIDRRGSVKAVEEEGYTFISKHRTYLDMPLIREYGKRAEKGMELFGKFYWNLWD